MPIAVTDYTWEESEKWVFITVPLKGVKANKVDIFSTEEYIKVSYPPYFFECFLNKPVFEQKSAAQIGAGAVIFKLEKQEPEMWERLQFADLGNKDKMKARREEAVKRAHQREEDKKKEKDERKREMDKYALNQQMKLEHEEKDRIKNVKETEIKKATEELEQWKEEQRLKALQEQAQLEEEKRQEEKEKEQEILDHFAAVNVNEKKENEKNIKSSHTTSHTVTKKTKSKKPSHIFQEEAEGKPMRETGKISVTFTPRVFPTAARESTAPEEDAWLKKQAEARRFIETENKDLSEEERNPVWLRDKGNSFFKSGDYQAAINAFSQAIRLQSTMPALYSNRAACHLKVRNFMKSLEDSSKALELLTPPVPQNAASRCKAHIRRGTAFCELEMYVEGLMDYDAALKIDPNNEQIKADADRIRTIIQSSEG